MQEIPHASGRGYIQISSLFPYENHPDENRPTSETRAMRALWRAVVLQALMDATGRSPRTEQAMARDESLRWLTQRSRDFFTVCDYADLDPDYIRTAARAALSRNCRWRKEKPVPKPDAAEPRRAHPPVPSHRS